MEAIMRERLRQHIQGWRGRLPLEWREFLAQSPEPNFEALPMENPLGAVDGPLFPALLDAVANPAFAGPHLLRAFDGIAPTDVRVVLIGQDPYPNQDRATGRAFEDGLWDGVRTQDIAVSLKPILLAALSTTPGYGDYFRPKQWDRIRSRLQANQLVMPDIQQFFDHLADQGVLCVNAAWTYSGPQVLELHLALWRPVMIFLLRALANREEGSTTFLALGAKACDLLDASVEEGAENINRIKRDHARQMRLVHNPLAEIDAWLVNRGEAPISWWPPN
jgi:uracil-DNA glycosylase